MTLIDVAKAQSQRFKGSKVFIPNRNYFKRIRQKKRQWLKNRKVFRIYSALTFY